MSEGATMQSILKFDAFQGLMTIRERILVVFNITVQSLARETGCSGLRLSKPYVERDISTTVHYYCVDVTGAAICLLYI